MSRRLFIERVAGVLSLEWGGLRIYAGPSPSSGGLGADAAPAEKKFLYGAHFYRPPNPPRTRRRQMLREIARRYEFNIIRVYPTWDYYNREPGQFDFEEIEEVMIGTWTSGRISSSRKASANGATRSCWRPGT